MSIEDALHAEYVGFLQKAERERRWSVFDDLPWERGQSTSPETLQFVHELGRVKSALVFALGLGPAIAAESQACADFRAAWLFEESRHRLALSDWLLRTELGDVPPPESVRSSTCPPWARCAETPRERAVLGYLTEMTTFSACAARRSATPADPCLRRLLDFVARDDIAHARFFEAALRITAEDDAAGTTLDVTRVAAAFVATAPLLSRQDVELKIVRPLASRLGDAASKLGVKRRREASARRAETEPS